MKEEVAFDSVDPRGVQVQDALFRYLTELSVHVVSSFVVSEAVDDVEAFTPPGGVFLLGRSGRTCIACGAVRALGPGVGELQRTWVEPN